MVQLQAEVLHCLTQPQNYPFDIKVLSCDPEGRFLFAELKIDNTVFILGVTSQFLCNVSDDILVPNFGRILVASLSNVSVASCYGAIIGILWIIGCSFQGTVLNMISCVFNVVKYNSNGIL